MRPLSNAPRFFSARVVAYNGISGCESADCTERRALIGQMIMIVYMYHVGGEGFVSNEISFV